MRPEGPAVVSMGEMLNGCTLVPASCSHSWIQIHRQQSSSGNSTMKAQSWQLGYREQRLFQRRKDRLPMIGALT